MALTRKFLSALGIDADKVDEIIEAHAETVNALKAERDEAKSKAEKAETLEKDLKKANEQIEALGSDEYQGKYEELRKEFEAYKAEQDAKATLTAKDQAYRKILKDAGISEKRIDAVMKVTDLSKIELDGEGLKDADKLTASIKEEWADFITTEHKEGAGTDNPPEGSGDEKKPADLPAIF